MVIVGERELWYDTKEKYSEHVHPSRELHHVVFHTQTGEKVPDESYALAHTPVTQEENTPASHQRCRVL